MVKAKKLVKTRKVARWTWRRVVAPTGKWAGGKILKPGATGAASTLRMTLKIARSVHEREKAIDRWQKRIEGRPVGWTGRTGSSEWQEIRRRRRGRKNAGGFGCRRCGTAQKMTDGSGHVCPKCSDCGGVLHTVRPHDCPKKIKSRSRVRSTFTRPTSRRPGRRPPPPANNPTRGARIVRANTASERFAQLPDADPDTFQELEALFNDVASGFNVLSAELTNFADDLPLHHVIKDALHKVADMTADIAEPMRDARRAARTIYAEHILAANTEVPVPKDKADYFKEA